MMCKKLLGGMLCLVLSACATHPKVDGMVFIPAGKFTMGSNKGEDATKWREANALNPYGFKDRLYIDERPQHKVTLPAFLIDKYEVTNAKYRDFVVATQHVVPSGWLQSMVMRPDV